MTRQPRAKGFPEGQDQHVFKVLRPGEWADFAASGRFEGSPDDRRDGFIHLSTAAQLPGTLSRHFGGEPEVMVLTVDATALGSALRWEPSRGGDLFPHHYGLLEMAAVRDRRVMRPQEGE